MNRLSRMLMCCGLHALLFISPILSADDPTFDGEWYTTFGVVKLKQSDDEVTGSYGDAGLFTIKGTVERRKLSLEFRQGLTKGEAKWTLDETGHSFQSEFQIPGGQAGQWLGWRPDPETKKAELAEIGGLWLTDAGLMELNQTGNSVDGSYAVRGGSKVKGTLTGRRFDFTYRAFLRGQGWFDIVDVYFAAPSYRTAKQWLADRN